MAITRKVETRLFNYECPSCGIQHSVEWDIHDDLDVTHAEDWDGLCPVCEEVWVNSYRDMEDDEDGT